MKLLKNLAGLTAGLLMITAPAHARVEESTKDLIQVLSSNGIQVTVNNDSCDGTFQGKYQWAGMKRWMILCPGDEVTASDHDTVRHEAVHAIQHCTNVARGNTNYNTPIAEPEKVWEYSKALLPESLIGAIGTNYPEDEWLVELEAALIAREMSGQEIAEMFIRACVAT